MDASLALTGPQGPLTLREAFEGRRQLIAYYFIRQLIAYYFMWNPGRPARLDAGRSDDLTVGHDGR